MTRRYFLVYFICSSYLVAGQSPKYALLDQTVKLNPGIKTAPEEILWKHNGNKVVAFNGNEEQVYSPYENRVTLDWHSADLDIKGLRYEDSGDYVLEVYANKVLDRSLYKLEVIDKVAKPTISCEMNNSDSSEKSGNQATLMCSADPGRSQSLMKFEWSSHGHMQPGQKLTISLGDERDDAVYNCTVRNPLTAEMTTFTAKDCYPDKTSAVLIAGLCVAIPAVCAVLGVVFCKLKHKACFAKEKRDDVEGKTKESEDNRAEGEERRPFLDRAPTFPSSQPLRRLAKSNDPESSHEVDAESEHDTRKEHDMNAQDETPRKGSVRELRDKFENLGGQKAEKKTRRPPLPPDFVTNHKGDADVDELKQPTEKEVLECDPSDSEEANDALSSVLDNETEDTPSDLQSPTASEQPEPEKEADEDEEAESAPANDVFLPAAQPPSPLTPDSPNVARKDDSGEHKEDTNSDQASGETTEKNVGESDSGLEEGKESDNFSEEKESSTSPEQTGEETTAHGQNSEPTEKETESGEDNQEEGDKQAGDDNDESNGVGDQEEIDEGKNLPLDSPQQPESPITSTPDNSNTDTVVESPDVAHAVPDQEEKDKTGHGRQSESSTEEADKGEAVEGKNEVQCGPEEEKLDNKSFSEDKDGQKKTEAVE